MGHPKKQRRKYSTPRHLFKGREGEKELVQAYGLKNCKELWKVKSEVSRVRALARQMLANPDQRKESELLGRLKRIGLVGKDAKLDDVLTLTVENLLDRRLQTIVYKRSLTTSIKQARQDIVHGHIAVNGRRMNSPGHITTMEEAEKIGFYMNSPLANPEHPLRKVVKKASTEGAEKRNAPERRDSHGMPPRRDAPRIVPEKKAVKEVIEEAIADVPLEPPEEEIKD